jgi:hypothetical protein
MTKDLQIVGFDPGGTSGWARFAVPRLCIFGTEDPEILEWDYGELTGPEPAQVMQLCRMLREFQGLDYKCGPALVSERWDADPSFKSTDTEQYSPVRINGMLELMFSQFPKLTGDATLHFSSRSDAFHVFTDERLKDRGLYVAGSRHIRSGTKHALLGLRRARENVNIAHSFWPYPASGLA